MYFSITYVQLRHICCTRKRTRSGDKKGTKSSVGDNFLTALKLWCIFCLFGLVWLFGALSITWELAYFSSALFVIFTSLQGLFVFVFLCIFNKDALMLYRRFCCGYSTTFDLRPESSRLSRLSTRERNNSLKEMGKNYTIKSPLAQALSVKSSD